MERYDFEVLNGPTQILVERDVAIPDDQAMWRRIARLARAARTRGRVIRVRKGAGIVVLIGVAAALQLCADLLANPPPM